MANVGVMNENKLYSGYVDEYTTSYQEPTPYPVQQNGQWTPINADAHSNTHGDVTDDLSYIGVEGVDIRQDRTPKMIDKLMGWLASTFSLNHVLAQHCDRINWDAKSNGIHQVNVRYPAYYESQNFHGVENGYLHAFAAVTYDPIMRYLLLPNERWVRQGLNNRIQGQPKRILDLGCGTGATTLSLKQQFPDADVVGLDLSTYMLVEAKRKAARTQLDVTWYHANAEQIPFGDEHFDLVTASLLFHETPTTATQAILREAHRVLKADGEMLILDANQATSRQTPWLAEIAVEPYLKEYANGNVDTWLKTAGFKMIDTKSHWWVYQVTHSVK